MIALSRGCMKGKLLVRGDLQQKPEATPCNAEVLCSSMLWDQSSALCLLCSVLLREEMLTIPCRAIADT